MALTQVSYPLPPSDAVQQQKKNIFEDLFSLVLSQFKKYYPCENLNFNYLGTLQAENCAF